MNAFASLARAVALDAHQAAPSPYTARQAALYAPDAMPVTIPTSHSLRRVYADAEFSTFCERFGIPVGIPIPRHAYDLAGGAFHAAHDAGQRDALIAQALEVLDSAGVERVARRHQPVGGRA